MVIWLYWAWTWAAGEGTKLGLLFLFGLVSLKKKKEETHSSCLVSELTLAPVQSSISMRISVGPILVSWLMWSLPNQYSPVHRTKGDPAEKAVGPSNLPEFPTWDFAVTLSSSKGNVPKTTAILVPTSAKVHTAVQSVLDEQPTWAKYQTPSVSKKKKKLKQKSKQFKKFSNGRYWFYLHSGSPGRKRPCMVLWRRQAGSCTTGTLFLLDGRCPHILCLDRREGIMASLYWRKSETSGETCQAVEGIRRGPYQTPRGWDTWSCTAPCSALAGPEWPFPASGSSFWSYQGLPAARTQCKWTFVQVFG